MEMYTYDPAMTCPGCGETRCLDYLLIDVVEMVCPTIHGDGVRECLGAVRRYDCQNCERCFYMPESEL